LSQFESRLLAEGVRTIEGASPEQFTYTNQSNETSFEALVLDRANQHDHQLQVSPLFSHFKKLTKNFYRLFACLLFLLGGLAVQKMLFAEQFTAINFFWAFTLFFIPNLLMLLVWLFLFLKPALLQSSSLSSVTLAFIKFFEKRFNKDRVKQEGYWALFRCYFEILFSKQLGRYQLSMLTHLLWLSYFVGATLMSVMMLATHQVDFIWQTSILSIDSFQMLTQLLAHLPQQLGFPVPSVEQIQQSHLGAEQLLDAESRRLAWSGLLISSLLLYGVVPRLILLVVMRYQFRLACVKYRLDLSLPYYVQLRQLLKPNKTSLGISDRDDEIPIEQHHKRSASGPVLTRQLNDGFYPLAIELSKQQFGLAQLHLAKAYSSRSVALVNVCDYTEQRALLTTLAASAEPSVAIYVALSRAPDRGLRRFIRELSAIKGKQFHLFLLIDTEQHNKRDSDWYQLASDVGIALDNILHINVMEANNE